jgi:hypothetical protein
VGGFEAPTMRGITDRWLQFSGGVTNVRDLLQGAALTGASDVPWSASIGFDELTSWALGFGSASQPGAFRSVYNVGPFDIFQMIEEMSTGQSGAVGRQLTLNLRSTTGGARASTESVLSVLETADTYGFVNLRGSGFRNGGAVTLSFRDGGSYEGGGVVLTRTQLLDEAAAGTTTLTLVAYLRESVDASTPLPTIWVPAASPSDFLQNGRPNLPQFTASNPGPITIRGRNIQPGAAVLLDGGPVWLDAPVACASGTLPNCSTTQITVDLAAPPATVGLHLLQLKNPDGLLTNELPVRRN